MSKNIADCKKTRTNDLPHHIYILLDAYIYIFLVASLLEITDYVLLTTPNIK